LSIGQNFISTTKARKKHCNIRNPVGRGVLRDTIDKNRIHGIEHITSSIAMDNCGRSIGQGDMLSASALNLFQIESDIGDLSNAAASQFNDPIVRRVICSMSRLNNWNLRNHLISQDVEICAP
jgi:hypothetical protein